MSATGAFEKLAADLAGDGVVAGSMFGKRSLTVGRKAFACLHGEELAVKLGAGTDAHADALALAGAHLFDPSGAGRPMKDWVSVPVAHVSRWPELAGAGLRAVRAASAS